MKRVHSCPHRILIAIRFLIPFFCIFLLFSSFVTWCFGDSEFQSIILLIDTSKSMDMTDTHQWRWTSVKVLINRLQIDQWICVMGFTDSMLPIIEPTRIGGNIEQRANLERKLSIPINGKEKKDGILGQALFQAEKTFQSMPSSNPQALILMTDSKAEFTRKQWNQFLKNSSGRKSFVLTNHQDKSISVSNGQKRPHSNLLTAFLYAVNDIDGYQFYEQKKILSKQHIFLHDPKIENLEFQFTSSQKRKSEIKIEDSQGNRIFPYFKTSHCASYWIPQPALGFWQVSLGNHNQVELLAFKKEKPNMSIGHLEFESPPLSYEPGREIDLQIRLAEGKYSFNQIYGKALWGEVEEKIIFHQTVDQSLYIAKYAPKEAGTHKFITDPNQDYIINPPIRTVELEMYQFPVWIAVSIMSGGIGIGGIVLLLFIFLRKRPTR
ncbi:MAG: VWA domain-containing protein, partial [Candidatus Poribacteria bacterium]|nr:VWA domain-containing protein [Candidatus Poribacteria bacterium]